MMLEERAATLAADLEADEDAIREDLENLLAYSVPVEEAERSLRRKYAAETSTEGPIERMDVADVTVDDGRVSLTAMVQSAGRRPIQYDGEERVITEGDLADATGSIGYTAWEDFGLDPGQTVAIEGASVREWDDRPELNLQGPTRVQEIEEDLGIDPPSRDPQPLKALEPGDRDVTIAVRVIDVEHRTIDGRHGETAIHSGVIADATARLPFTDWNAREAVVAGESIRIDNAYVREFRGVPTVNLSRFSTVSPAGEEVEPADSATVVSIGSALKSGAAYDVTVTGSVIDIREGSGLIDRCPQCQRVTRQGRCRSHGSVDGEPDLRVRGVLDDGTGSVTLILDTELTESIYGSDVGEAVAAAREEMDQAVVASRIRSRLLGRRWRVRGQLRIDEYGGTLDATEFAPVVENATDTARSVLDTLGGEQ